MYKFAIANVLLPFLIVTVYCYEFDDSYFNQILATDLEETQYSLDYSNSVVHPRARRDEEAVTVSSFDKCRKRRFKECCDTEFMENQHNQDREQKKECFKEIYEKDKDHDSIDPFKCEKVKKHRKDMTCFVKCVGQKRNLVDDNGDIREASFSEYVKDNFKESWLVPQLDTIITECLGEARNATTNHNKNDVDSCNPAAIKAAHCLFREIQMNCPEEQIKDIKTCSKFRERVKKHQELAPASQGLDE